MSASSEAKPAKSELAISNNAVLAAQAMMQERVKQKRAGPRLYGVL